jgi:hypothetical protein
VLTYLSTLRSGSRKPPFSTQPDLNLNAPRARTNDLSRPDPPFRRGPNAGDTETSLVAFPADASLSDWDGLSGREQIARWNQSDNIGVGIVRITLDGDRISSLVIA